MSSSIGGLIAGKRLDGHKCERADVIRGLAGEESMFGGSDHERDIGDHGSGKWLAAIRVDSGGEVHGGDSGSGRLAEFFHFRGESQQGFPKRALGAAAKQAIEKDQRLLLAVAFRHLVKRGVEPEFVPFQQGQCGKIIDGMGASAKNAPAELIAQDLQGDQGVPGVVAFSQIGHGIARSGKEAADGTSQPGSRQIQQLFLRPSCGKRRLLRRQHFRYRDSRHGGKLYLWPPF